MIHIGKPQMILRGWRLAVLAVAAFGLGYLLAARQGAQALAAAHRAQPIRFERGFRPKPPQRITPPGQPPVVVGTPTGAYRETE